MAKDLSGKTALVTGGSRNIGRETALALAARGADVVVTYRVQAAAAADTVAQIAAAGGRGAALQADFGDAAAIAPLVDGLRTQLRAWDQDGLDILVNNAGGLRIATLDKVTAGDLDYIYHANYRSVFLLTQALLGDLRADGRVVNLGSGVARIAFAPLVAYGPLKAALQSLTRYLAAHLGARGITVNAVAPGGLDDDFNAELFDTLMPAARDYIRGNTALGRVGLPRDVSGVIAFLCSPEAGFISGQTIAVDGGYRL